MYTIEQINAAIARKVRVMGTHSDMRRAGQPNPGMEVRISQAFDVMYDGRVRVRSEGYKGRFAVANVRIEDEQYDTTPDTY